MKLRKGDVLVITATDRNGNAGKDNGTRVQFIGIYTGRILSDGRRFLQLATVVYPEAGGAVGIGRSMSVIEREIVSIQNLGHIRRAQ